MPKSRRTLETTTPQVDEDDIKVEEEQEEEYVRTTSKKRKTESVQSETKNQLKILDQVAPKKTISNNYLTNLKQKYQVTVKEEDGADTVQEDDKSKKKKKHTSHICALVCEYVKVKKGNIEKDMLAHVVLVSMIPLHLHKEEKEEKSFSKMKYSDLSSLETIAKSSSIEVETLLDEYIKPEQQQSTTSEDATTVEESVEIVDYKGVKTQYFEYAIELEYAKLRVKNLIKDKLLIGYNMARDLIVLGVMSHPDALTRDLSFYNPISKLILLDMIPYLDYLNVVQGKAQHTAVYTAKQLITIYKQYESIFEFMSNEFPFHVVDMKRKALEKDAKKKKPKENRTLSVLVKIEKQKEELEKQKKVQQIMEQSIDSILQQMREKH